MAPATITTFGELDQRSLDQLTRCAYAGDADFAVLCADHHPGYSQPIGGVVAYRDYISPSGVGYDIACGNKAVKTNLTVDDGIPVAKVMDEIRDAAFAPQRKLADLAAGQLGTVGSGNHYVDLFADEAGAIWIGVHFGS